MVVLPTVFTLVSRVVLLVSKAGVAVLHLSSQRARTHIEQIHFQVLLDIDVCAVFRSTTTIRTFSFPAPSFPMRSLIYLLARLCLLVCLACTMYV